jgi:hypothetical protein
MMKNTPKLAIHALLLFLFASAIMLVSAESPPNLDPGLEYSTFIGTASWDGAEAIAVDSSGRAYIVAQTESTTGFPGSEKSAVNETAHEVNMTVTRLNPAGTAIEYVIYFNPTVDVENEDYGFDIAVDNTGAAYIVGQADKPDLCSFMGVVPGYDPTYNGGVDAFVMKIKPDGSGLEYCTFIGGIDWETAYTLELDQNNNVYLAGFTWSTDFPATNGAYDESNNGSRDIFVARLSANGMNLDYATYMGGTGQETATALALDSQNNVYVTGWTNSADLPTPAPVIDDEYNGPFDAFLFKLTSDGSDMPYNTYLGGTDEDRGSDIVVDDQGNIFVLGNTRSDDLRTTPGAFDRIFGGGVCFFTNCSDAFIYKINPSATTLQYGTYIGGDSEDLGHAAFPHNNGGLFITGETISSAGFPTTQDAYDTTNDGEGDGYLALLNATGSAVSYATYLGSTDVDRAISLWTDGQSTVYLTGLTLSTDFPTISGSYDTLHNGDYDIFVSKLIIPAQPEPVVEKSYFPAILK